MFGGGKFGGAMIFKTEVVNGNCPTCQADVIFVSLAQGLYRCTNCGSDLEQKVNGVISYIPATSSMSADRPVLKSVESDGPQQA